MPFSEPNWPMHTGGALVAGRQHSCLKLPSAAAQPGHRYRCCHGTQDISLTAEITAPPAHQVLQAGEVADAVRKVQGFSKLQKCELCHCCAACVQAWGKVYTLPKNQGVQPRQG